ncbi:MAG: SEC-C domain-containing protein [Clostridia bacterium]|nr:SEC-C domain-containing protein [Clostridia bacterium]
MVSSIREDTVRMLLSVVPKKQEIKRVEVAHVTSEGFSGGEKPKKKPVVIKSGEKIGRNDPCPCGSGKKYKRCHGAGLTDSAS